MSNEGSGDEPEWIDLDAPDPAPTLAPQGKRRRGWLLSVVAIAAVAAVLAAVALWPDQDEPDEEVASGDLAGEPTLFAVTSSGDLVEVDPATGEQVRLIAEQVADDPTNVAISVAPDGSAAYVGLRVPTTLDYRQEQPDVVAIDLASGSVTPVIPGRQPTISPDGQKLAVVAPGAPPSGSPSAAVLDIGTEREPLSLRLTSTPNQPSPLVAIQDLAWSPDGAHLYASFGGDQVHGNEVFDVAEQQSLGSIVEPGPGRHQPAAYLGEGVVATVDTRSSDPGLVVEAGYVEGDAPPVAPPTTPIPDGSVDTTWATVGPGPSSSASPAADLVTGGPVELFRVDGTVIDLAAPIGDRRLAAVVEPTDGGAPRLVVWSKDGGVVDLADGVTATAWGPPSAPEPDPESTTTSASDVSCSAAELVESEPRPQAGLPPAVAVTRTAIIDAAITCDYEALLRLLDADLPGRTGPDGVGRPIEESAVPSTSAAGDVIEFWRDAEARGEPRLRWMVETFNRSYFCVVRPDQMTSRTLPEPYCGWLASVGDADASDHVFHTVIGPDGLWWGFGEDEVSTLFFEETLVTMSYHAKEGEPSGEEVTPEGFAANFLGPPRRPVDGWPDDWPRRWPPSWQEARSAVPELLDQEYLTMTPTTTGP